MREAIRVANSGSKNAPSHITRIPTCTEASIRKNTRSGADQRLNSASNGNKPHCATGAAEPSAWLRRQDRTAQRWLHITGYQHPDQEARVFSLPAACNFADVWHNGDGMDVGQVVNPCPKGTGQ